MSGVANSRSRTFGFALTFGRWYRDLGGRCALRHGVERLPGPSPLTSAPATSAAIAFVYSLPVTATQKRRYGAVAEAAKSLLTAGSSWLFDVRHAKRKYRPG